MKNCLLLCVLIVALMAGGCTISNGHGRTWSFGPPVAVNVSADVSVFGDVEVESHCPIVVYADNSYIEACYINQTWGYYFHGNNCQPVACACPVGFFPPVRPYPGWTRGYYPRVKNWHTGPGPHQLGRQQRRH